MVPEISEEDFEETSEIIDPEVQKQRIRQIIEYQKSVCLSSTFSSSVASCSSLSSSHKGNSLLESIERGRFSLGRLFEMEHASLATHWQDFNGSPMIKPISLRDNDRDDRFHDPWMSIRQIGPTRDLGPDEFGLENREARIMTRKLSRTKSFRRLPGFGCCICRGFWFKLKSRLPQIMVFRRKFWLIFTYESVNVACKHKWISMELFARMRLTCK